MPSYLTTLLALPFLASAHFHLHFPSSRGDDDAEQASFPCGGYEQTQNRTAVSLTSIPISMELGHTENLISVFLAIGNDVGSAFNYELQPTIQEFGPGDYCWAGVAVPSTLNVTDGTNATVQVITNAHSGGGLYNVCIALSLLLAIGILYILSSAPISPSHQPLPHHHRPAPMAPASVLQHSLRTPIASRMRPALTRKAVMARRIPVPRSLVPRLRLLVVKLLLRSLLLIRRA